MIHWHSYSEKLLKKKKGERKNPQEQISLYRLVSMLDVKVHGSTIGLPEEILFSKEKRATQVIQQHNDPKYQSKYTTEWLKKKRNKLLQ